MLYGALTAAVYLLTCGFYRKGPQAYSHTTRELFAWFFCSALLFLFWKGYQQINRADNPSIRTIVIFAGIFCLFAFFTVPFHSTDAFGYINRGWQQVHYGQNPYVHHLNDIPNWQQDPTLREHWIYNPNPYGFLFTLLARLIAQASGGHWWLALALFKATNVVAYAATGWILWSASKRLSFLRPETALYLFLWNPLILLHHIANGHNDVLLGLLVVLAAYLAITQRYFWIVPALVGATLLKFAPALLIPPALIFVTKKAGWKTAALSCLVGLAIGALTCFPYLRDWQALRLVDIRDNATLIDNSLHSLLIHLFENIARLFPSLAEWHGIVNSAIKGALRGGLLIFVLYQWVKIPRNFTAGAFIFKSLLILFVLICVASSKFNAWYLAMILPLALLLEDEHWLRRLVVLISCTELLSFTFFKQAYMINYFALILVPAWVIFKQSKKRSTVAARPAGTEFFPMQLAIMNKCAAPVR
jgi:hypothetical protein